MAAAHKAGGGFKHAKSKKPKPPQASLPVFVGRASRSTIKSSFAGLGVNFPNDLWLQPGNTFVADPVTRLRQDTKTAFTGSNHDLADYIAASAPLHCADGWGYLARALTACFAGDEDTTRHLAYYASLRGAMSLLAAEGIGAFDHQHYIVEPGPVCTWIDPFNVGTHKAVWNLLMAWADQQPASDLLDSMINAGGSSIGDWLDAFSPGASLVLIGRQWLRSWGLDLSRFADDRNARNASSYRPTRLTARNLLAAREVSDFVRDFWRSYQPYGSTRFERLDQYLLRRSIEMAFELQHGKRPADARPLFEAQVDKIFTVFTPWGMSEPAWKAFLKRQSQPDDYRIILAAEGTALPSQPEHHLQAIARAALLLRIATGAASQLIKDNGFSSEDIDFWWKRWGFSAGFWQIGAETEPLTDLWLEVDTALNAYTDPSATEQACFPLWIRREQQRSGIDLAPLRDCERIGLWSLAS